VNIIWNAVRYVTVRGLLAGAGLGALYGTGVYPAIGTAFGALFGAIVGLGAGVGCGLYIGLLTRLAYYPLTDLLQYQRFLTLTTAVIAYFAADLGFTALLGRAFFSGFIPPTLIAAGAAIYVALGFAARYIEDEKPKRKREVIHA
jgi:hypothetical protein